MNLAPYTDREIWNQFEKEGSITKHLLILYSLSVGINAKRIAEIGIGSTTRVFRKAAAQTGGTLFSCDADKKRFEPLLEKQTPAWQLHLGNSDSFLKELEAPVDFFLHDGAHDFYQVRTDLRMILPLMRTFGLICIHDTQQYELGPDMMNAIREAADGWHLSILTLPFCCGMTLIRVESGPHPEITPAGKVLADGRLDTKPFPTGFQVGKGGGGNVTGHINPLEWVKWKIRRLLNS